MSLTTKDKIIMLSNAIELDQEYIKALQKPIDSKIAKLKELIAIDSKEQLEADRDKAIAEVSTIIHEANGTWVPDWKDTYQAKAQLDYEWVGGELGYTTRYDNESVCLLPYFNHKVWLKVKGRISQSQINLIFRLGEAWNS